MNQRNVKSDLTKNLQANENTSQLKLALIRIIWGNILIVIEIVNWKTYLFLLNLDTAANIKMIFNQYIYGLLLSILN